MRRRFVRQRALMPSTVISGQHVAPRNDERLLPTSVPEIAQVLATWITRFLPLVRRTVTVGQAYVLAGWEERGICPAHRSCSGLAVVLPSVSTAGILPLWITLVTWP